MVTFSIALLLFCFSISNPLTRIFVAVTSVIMAALIGWCIHGAWESSEEKGMWIGRMLPYFKRAVDHFHAARRDILPPILRRGSRPSLLYDRSVSLSAIPNRERVNV